MLRNKTFYFNKFTLALAAFFLISMIAAPAEAKKKKEKTTPAVPEILDPTAPVEEVEDAVEAIGFDPDSLFFVTPDENDIRNGALEAILPHYNEWSTVRLNGSLRLKGLPISPSLRIYMEKDKCISISVRVSLLGEVGRIEMAGDTILGINKMKRTYCVETLGNLKYDYPNLISDIQSLLLGRITILQSGELAEGNSKFADFSLGDARTTGWFIDFPRGRTESDEFAYRYSTDPDGMLQNLFATIILGEHNYALNIGYEYPSDGYDMDIRFAKDERVKFSGTLSFGEPDWDGQPLDSFQITSRYTEMSISQFIKSFKL